jgi:hypothetical protein
VLMPVLARGAVIPGPAQPHLPDDSVDDLAAVAGEHGLMPVPAGHHRATVARISLKQLPEDLPAQPQHALPDQRLSRRQPRPQYPRRLPGQLTYLSGPLRREDLIEPPFSPPIPEGSPPAL